LLIHKIDDWLYTPQPLENDTRPAEVWTRETTDYDLVKIEQLLHSIEDSHWLSKNYTIDQIEKLKVISLMKRDDKIVGFSGIQEVNYGSRILSRLYQVPDNRIQFTRELLRPTIHAMVEHQLFFIRGQAIISREPRQANYFKRFVDALNRKSTSKWFLDDKLYEVVKNSNQYVAWRL
jgi:hypothetical protein